MNSKISDGNGGFVTPVFYLMSSTLSDFVGTYLYTRPDGSVSPVIAIKEDGEEIGLSGFKGDKSKSDYEIKEDAFQYWQLVMEEMKKNNVA